MGALPNPDDTIAALASAPGPAARGIVRISGPAAHDVVARLTVPQAVTAGANASSGNHVARCVREDLAISGLGRPVPAEVCQWYGRRSYTGQPLVELHLPGSPPLLEAVLNALYREGARPAQPGEFTLRSFLAGRMDLLQAEAVLGVIDATSLSELQAALDQLGGGVSSRIIPLRGDLLDLLADLEAGLDFADEAIEFVSHATLIGRLGLAREAVESLLNFASGRLRSSTRPRVVLVGLPNAGKSTLFNALVQSEAALVSEERGTTRDYLAADLEVGRLGLTLLDTAGHETAEDGISAEAQRQRKEQLTQADLVIWCRAADTSAAEPSPATEAPVVTVITKCDLTGEQVAPVEKHEETLRVSALTGSGLAELRKHLESRLADQGPHEGGLLGTTAARCRESLQGTLAALDRALDIARHEADQELLAIEIREALDALGQIVGDVYTDDILDRIFSKFCIGK